MNVNDERMPASAHCPTIRTNGHYRDIISGYELTDKEREEFDYLSDDDLFSASFVKYKGHLYHLADVMAVNINHCLPLGFEQYDGYVSETFFSGVLFKYSENCESVKCASYFS